MKFETMIGVLVAIAVPLWLALEQVLKWRIFGPGRPQQRSDARADRGPLPGVGGDAAPITSNNTTGPAFRRRAA